MRNEQKGFTLIELVVVIVILGILAAVAIPKFVDLSAEAQTAALSGVQGGMNSAMSINYSGCAAKNNAPTANKCAAVANCSDVASLMTGSTPNGYTVTAGAIGAGNGTSLACTVTQDATSNSVTFTAIRAGT